LTAVEVDVGEMRTRIEVEALRLINDGLRQGKTGRALADYVRDGLNALSDAPIARASRGAASTSFNLGRNLAAQARPLDIREAIRSEVLDAETCRPCRKLDGKRVVVDSPEYFELMPPAQCDGRDFCRGFYLYRRAA
jgi:hypothetical protein